MHNIVCNLRHRVLCFLPYERPWVRGCIVCVSVSTLQSIMQIYGEIVYISVQKLILNMQMKVDVSE
jgi:hypothetical protein